MTEPAGEDRAFRQPGRAARPTAGAEPPQVPWGVLDALLVALLAFAVSQLLAVGLSAVLPRELARGALLPAAAGALALVTAGYVRLRFPGSARLLLGRGRWSGALVGLGALHGMVALAFNLGVGLAVSWLAERVRVDPPQPQEGLREALADPSVALLVAVGVVAITPLAEELFFRGMLFQALWRRVGLWPGLGLSAAVFALAHLGGGTAVTNLFVFAVLFPVGLYMAWVFSRHRHLGVAVTMHAVYNAVATLGIVGGWL